MNLQNLRVGFVGAGANTRHRHLPGLKAIPGVTFVAVANRTPGSAEKVAHEWSIPKVCGDWKALIASPDVDAVVIGTWPDSHCEITCAALAAGKHVLCEARMARTLAEARQMQAAALQHPELVSMLVPSPFGLTVDTEVHSLLEGNYLGELREVVVIGCDDQFQDYSQPLHWRQDSQISGLNTLTLGILHETVSRWIPPTTRVLADSQIFEPVRPNPHAPGSLPVSTPETVNVLTRFGSDGRGVYRYSGMHVFGSGKQIHLYGSAGTLQIHFGDEERIFAGRLGDSSLQPLTIPDHNRGKWRAEEEFVGAIRGTEKVRFTTFSAGVDYMEFTEAVSNSATSGQAVTLPLPA